MWKNFILNLILLVGLINSINGQSATPRVVCYYDSRSSLKEGLGKVTPNDTIPGLSLCTHLVYGYAGILPDTFKVAPIISNEELDTVNGLFRQVTQLKKYYPSLKILLSVGGDADEGSDKYLALLESSTGRISFTNSINVILKTYGFDGLDLAFQFPKIKPKKIRSAVGSFFYSIKKTVGAAGKPVDENSEAHKNQFTSLVVELKNSFRLDNYELAVTILPNVNASLYLDVPSIKNYVDFITLAAFDVYTPARNPKEADYVAPTLSVTDRNVEENVDFVSTYLVANGFAGNKIVIGLPTYGRAWKIEKDATITGSPPVAANGPAPEAVQTRTPGFLSYPEICSLLLNDHNKNLKGEHAPLRRIADPTKRYGVYAFRLPDDQGGYGMWVGYEDPESAGNKASFVKGKGLGGVAVFDLSTEDIRGSCTPGQTFPILMKIKEKLK
jgi:GH18 family chitinase